MANMQPVIVADDYHRLARVPQSSRAQDSTVIAVENHEDRDVGLVKPCAAAWRSEVIAQIDH